MSSFRRPSGLWLSLLIASVPLPLSSAVAQAPPTLPQSSPSWPDPAVKEICKKWLEEDVAWIITGQERADFVKLSTDKQRDEFVVAFWERRNPTPGSSENKFKEQHYRRLAYANTHFAASVAWMENGSGTNVHPVRPSC